MGETIRIGRFKFKISSPEKILFPDVKITKGDLIDYYRDIVDTMFPLVKDRLISMVRFPEGVDGEIFYQKDAPEYFPYWITRVPIEASKGKEVKYVLLDKKATLVFLANQVCTPHTWLSTVKKIYYPDRLIFDLDPSGKKFDFNVIRNTALAFRDILEEIGLYPYVMTTGSRGLHITVPIKQTWKFEEVRNFAKSLCQYMAHQAPKKLTVEMSKSKRGNKIFLDYLRNSVTATSVAPYAVREKPGAHVATPIDWKEVKDKDLTSKRYDIHSVFQRLKKHGEPWHDMKRHARALDKPAEKLKAIIKKESFTFEL